MGLSKKTGGPFLIDGLTDLAFNAIDRIAAYKKRVEKSFKVQGHKFQRWMIETVVLAFLISMCLVFFTLGLFFLAMDLGGYSRGLVFTTGGLIGLLILGWKISTKE